jgi:integrase
MTRARQQQAGHVFLRCGFWYVRYRENVVLKSGAIRRVQKCRRLTRATGEYRNKRAVEQLAEKTLRPLNDGIAVAESTMSLNRFIESTYFPYAEQQKRRSTYFGYRNIWKRYVRPNGDRALRDYRTFDCEQMLLSIARRKNLCRTTLGHIKHFLSGVFRYARRQGVLETPNPMTDVELPKARPAGETQAYALEEELQMLAVLPEPAATAVAVAAFTGARKGEIRGFLWENYDGHAIEVKKAVWRGHVDEPKREKSKGAIPVIAQLKLFLDQHRARLGCPSQGYIFQSPYGKPLNLDALASKVIRPALKPAGLPWYGWHAFRRGLATNLHRLGIADKVIQQILRHANVTTTMNIYVKLVTRDAAEAMKVFEAKCATVVQQPLLVSELKLGETARADVKQISTAEQPTGILAERGGFEPPVGVLAPTTV